MRIGAPKETAPGERRVALVPDAGGRLVKAGHEVLVQRGAGESAFYPDREYATAGASLAEDASAALGGAERLLKVQKPSAEGAGALRPGTTAAGTLAPAKTFVLGAGVAGLQAIATARRLGAIVSAFDVRPVVKEQVQSLGASFVEAEQVSAEGKGGYATELAEEQQRKVLE